MNDFFNSAKDFLNNSTVSNLVGNLTARNKPAPAPAAPAPVINVQAPSMPSAGMSKGMMFAIGGGVLGVILIAVVIFKRK